MMIFKKQNKKQKGFTLLEVVLSLALASVLVVIGVQIYQMVLRTGSRLESAPEEWTAEQFMRSQIYVHDQILTSRAAAAEGKTYDLWFVTRRSAQFGADGPPVFVHYELDLGGQVLRYEEIIMPSWWDRKDEDFALEMKRAKSNMRNQNGYYATTMMHNIQAGQFYFWDKGTKEWQSFLDGETALPPVIKLAYQQIGTARRDIVLEPGVSSLFLPYGY